MIIYLEEENKVEKSILEKMQDLSLITRKRATRRKN